LYIRDYKQVWHVTCGPYSHRLEGLSKAIIGYIEALYPM
jgi:hypothetical protein